MLSRHVPGLRHLTSRLPAGALPRVHLRHAVSRANPFRAVRSLPRHVEDGGNGAGVASVDAPNGRAPQAALQQALSHASGGSGGSGSTSSQAPTPSSGSETSVLSRHVPGLRHLASRLPAGALPRVHLRHAVSRANPFRAARSLSRHVEDSGAPVQTVTYEVRCPGAT